MGRIHWPRLVGVIIFVLVVMVLAYVRAQEYSTREYAQALAISMNGVMVDCSGEGNTMGYECFTSIGEPAVATAEFMQAVRSFGDVTVVSPWEFRDGMYLAILVRASDVITIGAWEINGYQTFFAVLAEWRP